MQRKIDILELATLYERHPIWCVIPPTKAYTRIMVTDIKRWSRLQPPPKFTILAESNFGVYIEETTEEFHVH